MKRLLCYAHFDEQGALKPFVRHALATMAPLCATSVLVSNSPLSGEDVRHLENDGVLVMQNDNIGYDFRMWQKALEAVDYRSYDEVVLMNSSVYGPIFPLDAIFAEMTARPNDFWGITECFQMQPHVQSYFFVFRKKVIMSEAFAAFWQGVLPYRNKLQVIQSYEVGLTQWLVEAGFRPDVYCSFTKLGHHCRSVGRRLRRKDNTSVKHAGELLAIGNPFLKRDAVRKGKTDPALITGHMNMHNYPLALIDEKKHGTAPLCPLCGSPGKVRHKGVRDYRNMHNVGRYDYLLCRNSACRVLWLHPVPDAAARNAIRLTEPVPFEDPAFSETGTAHRVPAAAPLLFITNALFGVLGIGQKRQRLGLSALDRLPPGKVLVIGAWGTHQMATLQQRGWDVVCLETVSDMDNGTNNHGDGIADGCAAGSFDAVVLSRALERAPQPGALLAACHRLLKTGGRLIVSTPNGNAFTRALFGACWSGLNAPRNRAILRPASVRALLATHGFEDRTVRTTSLFSEVYAQHSLDALVNKWTSPVELPRLGRELLPVLIQLAASGINALTGRHGDDCVAVATRK